MTTNVARPPQLTDWHLAGEAAVYMRQSSMQQVRENLGSGIHQRSLEELLRAMGFPEARIRVIDEDLGQSGTAAKNRSGLQALVADILAGVVRVVAVSEISRLGRNAVELVKFLALCEWKNVLLLENGVPRNLHETSDWTAVQLQAVLAEHENRQKSQRSQSGRLAKARTGLPACRIPCGFERGPNGEALKTADAAVRAVLERIWREALDGRSPGDIVKGLRADGVQLPTTDAKGRIRWIPPQREVIFRILNNPFYAGFLVLWRHRTERHPDGKFQRPTRPEEQEWVRGQIEAYVTPDEYRRVRDLLAARSLRNGAWVGEGIALCSGLVHCGTDGRRLQTKYESVRRAGSPQRRPYRYVCFGAPSERRPGPFCMSVSGTLLDRAIEEIVLAELRCPAPATLRRAIHEENTRRQAAARLRAVEAEKARGEADEAHRRVEESRQHRRNPNVIQCYEDEWETALNRMHEAERRLAIEPRPTLVDDSPAFVGQMTAAFDEFPKLWRSDRLGPRERKDVVRRVVSRIDLLATGDTPRVAVTLHGGKVLERVLFGHAWRRKLIEALDAAGHTPEEIAAELRRREILNHRQKAYCPDTLKHMLRQWKGRSWGAWPNEQTILDALRRLWNAALLPTDIAERLNAEGFRTKRGNPWTVDSVTYVARLLGLPSRQEVHREVLRPHVSALVAAGLGDAAIAEELAARGFTTFSRAPWTAVIVRDVRRDMGIYRRRPRKRNAMVPPDEACP